MAGRGTHRPSTGVVGGDSGACREHRPPDGARGSGLRPRGLSSTYRHLAAELPGSVPSSRADVDSSVIRRVSVDDGMFARRSRDCAPVRTASALGAAGGSGQPGSPGALSRARGGRRGRRGRRARGDTSPRGRRGPRPPASPSRRPARRRRTRWTALQLRFGDRAALPMHVRAREADGASPEQVTDRRLGAARVHRAARSSRTRFRRCHDR